MGPISQNPNEKFDRGLNKWKGIFGRLRDPPLLGWNGTNGPRLLFQRNWEEYFAEEGQRLIFEAELWYSASAEKQNANQAIVEELVGDQFSVKRRFRKSRFSALSGDLPARAARRLINLDQNRLVRCDRIMFFGHLDRVLCGPLPTTIPRAQWGGGCSNLFREIPQ